MTLTKEFQQIIDAFVDTERELKVITIKVSICLQNNEYDMFS